LQVTKTTDPVTKKDVFIAPDGYDATKDDDKHSCDDPKPSVGGVSYSGGVVSFTPNQGKFNITSIEIFVDGNSVGTVPGTATSASIGNVGSGKKITVTATDDGYYTGTSKPYTTP
jgi:hypothetical protein